MLSRIGAAFLAIAFAVPLLAGAVSLDGNDWALYYRHQQEGGAWQSVPAQVPGEVNLDLLRTGLVLDPSVGTNLR